MLPALRASLIWFKRETVRALRNQSECVSSPRVRDMLNNKATKVSKTDLADLRAAYQTQRVTEIVRYRRAELSQVVPSIVWVSA